VTDKVYGKNPDSPLNVTFVALDGTSTVIGADAFQRDKSAQVSALPYRSGGGADGTAAAILKLEKAAPAKTSADELLLGTIGAEEFVVEFIGDKVTFESKPHAIIPTQTSASRKGGN